MQLKELTYIVTLAEEKTISGAAAKLYMAQSSLSEFLQQQESELGVKLFVRSSRGLRPTEAGQLYIDTARTIMAQYRTTQTQLHDIAGLRRGQVVLGISSFRGRYMVPLLLTRFQKEYPDIKVKIVEGNSYALESMLVEGSIDMAVVVLPLSRLSQEVEPLFRDEICLVAHKDHPVLQHAHRKEDGSFWVDLKDTESYEYIIGDVDTILGNFSRQQFRKNGIVPPAYNTTITADLAASMARAGLGLAFTYRACAVESHDTVYLSVGEEGQYIDLALAYPLASYQSHASRALARVAHQVWGGR